MRFGIGYQSSFTLDEIGKRFNLTRERIRKIEKKAISTIRHSESTPALTLKSLIELVDKKSIDWSSIRILQLRAVNVILSSKIG